MSDSEQISASEERDKSPIKKKKSKTPAPADGADSKSSTDASTDKEESKPSDTPTVSVTPASPEQAPTTPEKQEKMLKERFRVRDLARLVGPK
jgi:hypothetical protein